MSGPVTALAAALELAEEGLPVFPCQQNKQPFAPHGFKDASVDPTEIKRWWRRWPGALVGVPTGRASGLLVIDVDPAGATWHRENDHRLACGWVHRTRRAHHLLYRYPSNSEIRNNAGRLAPGVDVRGEGGYVVWWPAHGLEVAGGMEDLGAPPEWLLAELTNGAAASHTGAQVAGGYITEGRRNDFLSREAHRFRKQGCNADQIAEALRALNNARCSPPLPDAEVVEIVNGKARISSDGAAAAGPRGSEEWPQAMDPEATHGIAGEIVKAIEPHTEADSAALLVQVLVAFGVLVGRSPYVQVEGDRHYLNLFELLTGETSKGRKGTSWGRVRSIFERASEWPRVVSGLSSGEGLKWQVRDKRTEMVKDKKSGTSEEVVMDEGVKDKRLLVIEPEFAQVLRVVTRHGNTLSSTVRTAWDTGTLATLTKNDPVTATDAHIAIIGHITIDELRAELTQTDTANGFANRFLFVCVKRSKCLPFGGEGLSDEVVAGFAKRLEQAASAARRVGRVTMTQAARNMWAGVYPRLSQGMPGLFGTATARGEAQALRLAMLYALLDEKAQIDGPHLLAGLAVWEYAEASARYVFGSSLGDPVADVILRAARSAGQDGMTRTQIRDLFNRNCSAERLGAALDLLARRNFIRRLTQETGGRPSEVWVSV